MSEGAAAVKPDLLRLEYLPLETIAGWPRNPKRHDDKGIGASMGRFGYTEPILLDEATGRLVSGHGRIDQLRALKKTGKAAPSRIDAREDDWYIPVVRGVAFASEAEAEAYILAANQLTTAGGWDEVLLKEIAADLSEKLGEAAFDGTGFSAAEIEKMLPDPDADKKSSLLALTDITIDDPEHEVHTGDVWLLGDRHVMIVCDVFVDWPTWVPFLTDPDALFIPYPGPYVPLTKKASELTIVMVQPDTYIAGHILDRYVEIYGADSVRFSEAVTVRVGKGASADV